MAKNDDVEQANPGVPSADIPDLKKKEKERKRGGAAWSGARAPGGTFQGATGGAARAAASAAGSTAGSAAAGGAQTVGVGLVARLAALSVVGKFGLAAAAVMLFGGAAILGSYLLRGGGQSGNLGGPDLGAISSSVKVRAAGNDRIGVDSRGEIAFDPVEKAKPAEKKAEEPKPAETAPMSDGPSAADAAKQAAEAKDKLAHNLSGAKLSASLGGQFGGKDIFAGSGKSEAPKFGASAPKFVPKGGKALAMRAGGVRSNPSARSVSRSKTSKALGQLKRAQGLSLRGATASGAENASATAAGAFEQNDATGGALNTATPAPATPADLSGTQTGNDGTGSVTAPDTYAFDDIQNMINQIKSMTDQAKKMQEQGLMLLALGTVIFIIGVYLEWNVWTAPLGWILIILGLGLMYSGYSMMQKAKETGDKAKQMGEQLAARTGEFQSKVVQDCVKQAIDNLTSVDQCRSLESEQRQQQVEEQTQRDLEQQKEISADTEPTP